MIYPKCFGDTDVSNYSEQMRGSLWFFTHPPVCWICPQLGSSEILSRWVVFVFFGRLLGLVSQVQSELGARVELRAVSLWLNDSLTHLTAANCIILTGGGALFSDLKLLPSLSLSTIIRLSRLFRVTGIYHPLPGFHDARQSLHVDEQEASDWTCWCVCRCVPEESVVCAPRAGGLRARWQMASAGRGSLPRTPAASRQSGTRPHGGFLGHAHLTQGAGRQVSFKHSAGSPTNTCTRWVLHTHTHTHTPASARPDCAVAVF